MALSSDVKQAAHTAGADLVGVASIDRFEGVPAEHHPRSIFPETASVVVLGKRVVRGCLRGVEEGTQFALYDQYAVNWVPDRFLALITVAVATYLEDNRWEAVPLPDLPAGTPPMGVPVRPGQPAPNVMVDTYDAAVRAGLGRFGYSGEFLTPQFGPRQRLQTILTDAPLESDPLQTDPVCRLCKACVATCPLGALKETEETILDICGLRMPMAGIDWETCAVCKNGARPNPRHPSGRPDRLAALCQRTCVHHWDAGAGERGSFQSPFRKRPAWRVDAMGNASTAGEV